MVSWTKLQLPTPTNDLDKVANDIDQWGYGLLEDALSEPLLTKTRARLLEQAAAELQFGLAFEDGGPSQKWGDFRDPDGALRSEVFTSANGGINQRVWLLPNKGEEFLEVLEIMRCTKLSAMFWVRNFNFHHSLPILPSQVD